MNIFVLIISFGVSVANGEYHYFDDIVDCNKYVRDYINEVHIPVPVLYIIGFLMIIMLIIIICLAVLLYRTRMKEYKINPPPNQLQPVATNPDLSRTYMTQTSHEMTILKMNSQSDSLPVTQQNEDRNYEGNHNSLTSSSSSKDLKRTTIDRHAGLGKDFKVYRSVKRSTDQQLILKEQMKKICEDALARSNMCGMTASLKDLNKLLQDHNDQIPERGEAKDESASFPEIDVYDNAPSNIPVPEMAGEAVYDCLPSSQSKNIIVEDYDSKYLLALSKENLTEPAYINAQYRYNQF